VVDQSPGSNGKKIVKLPPRPADSKTNVTSDLTFDAESLLSSSVMSDSTSAWIQHIGQKFREVLQVKARRYPDLQAVESSGMLNCLDVIFKTCVHGIVKMKYMFIVTVYESSQFICLILRRPCCQ